MPNLSQVNKNKHTVGSVKESLIRKIVLKPMSFYSWVGLVSKNYEIERACMELERESQDLENQREKINWKRKHEQLEDETKPSHPEDGQVFVFVVLI